MLALSFNPLYFLVPPGLILTSIPLTCLAIFTSAIAFTTLLVRVSIVYFELAVALLRSALFTDPPKPTRRTRTQAHTLTKTRSSLHSNASSQDFGHSRRHAPTKSDSFASLLGAGAQGPSRDFEGVGGWRDAGNDPAEEALWIGMNSRLELPAIAPERQRRHQRSLTGGSQRWSGVYSPEAIRMSPVQSRARTPSVTDVQFNLNGEEYFEYQPHMKTPGDVSAGRGQRNDGKRKGMATPGADEKKRLATANNGERRKSSSGSSISSISSGKPSRSTTKKKPHG